MFEVSLMMTYLTLQFSPNLFTSSFWSPLIFLFLVSKCSSELNRILMKTIKKNWNKFLLYEILFSFVVHFFFFLKDALKYNINIQFIIVIYTVCFFLSWFPNVSRLLPVYIWFQICISCKQVQYDLISYIDETHKNTTTKKFRNTNSWFSFLKKYFLLTAGQTHLPKTRESHEKVHHTSECRGKETIKERNKDIKQLHWFCLF